MLFLFSATHFFLVVFFSVSRPYPLFSPAMDDIWFSLLFWSDWRAHRPRTPVPEAAAAGLLLASHFSGHARHSSRLPRDIACLRASMVLFSAIGAPRVPLVVSFIFGSGTSESASKLEGMSEFPSLALSRFASLPEASTACDLT